MKYLLLLVMFISCKTENKQEKIKIKTVSNKEIFNSTQQYEISCWIIKKSEGYSDKSYRCSAGKLTTGWGFCHVKSVKNIHHADIIFRDLRNKLFKQVQKEYPKLSYLKQSAILSLYYNTGNLNKIKNSGFSKALEDKNIDEAVLKFKSWCKIKIKGKTIIIKGLQNRRNYESKLLSDNFTMEDYLKLKKEIEHLYVINKTT